MKNAKCIKSFSDLDGFSCDSWDGIVDDVKNQQFEGLVDRTHFYGLWTIQSEI